MVYTGVVTIDPNSFDSKIITTLGEALEQAMKIEAMEGYPGSLWVMRPPNIIILQVARPNLH
jgi:hypothetical protein